MEKDEEKEVKKKKELNKKLLIVISVIGSIVLLIVVMLGVSSFKRNQTIKQADSFIAMDKFEEGIAIYDLLLSEKYIPELINKRNLAMDLMESNENLEKGIEAFDDDQKQKAIKYLSKVPKTDKKRYDKALEFLEDLEAEALFEVGELIESDNLDEASKLATQYLKLYPDSIDIHNAKEDIVSKLSEAENKEKAEEQSKKETEAANAKAAKNESVNQMKNEEARTIASNLKYSTKSIISKQANLRSAPTLNSSVVSVLSQGTQVYIYDTQIESSSRIWCKVQDEYGSYGWISYNTMNYTLK